MKPIVFRCQNEKSTAALVARPCFAVSVLFFAGWFIPAGRLFMSAVLSLSATVVNYQRPRS